MNTGYCNERRMPPSDLGVPDTEVPYVPRLLRIKDFMPMDDQITIVGSSYFQPIADLIEKLVSHPFPSPGPAGTSHRESGYSNALVILLVTVLESYTARVRFLRPDDVATPGTLPTPELLLAYFPDLPTYAELLEVFMLRNLIAHNHVWHLDTSVGGEARTISTPQQLGFHTKKNYRQLIDVDARRTRSLDFPASPSSVDRSHVQMVFEVVWKTLEFMQKKDYSHTPLGGRTVGFKGKRRRLEDLIAELGTTP